MEVKKLSNISNKKLTELLKLFNGNTFSVYEFLAGELGIYHIFYGHKVNCKARRRLKYATRRLEIIRSKQNIQTNQSGELK